MHAYLYLIFATLCWGANTVFARLLVDEASPMVVVSIRWLSTVLLLSLYAHREIKQDWPIIIKHWRFLALMGASGYALFNGFYYLAAHTTTALNIGIIQGAIPVFVLLGTYLVYQTAISKAQMIGVVLTLIGVVVVTSQGEIANLLALIFSQGDLLMLIACLCYALYTIGLKRRPAISAWSLIFSMALAAFLVSLPMSATELWLGYSQAPTAKAWLVIALITLFPSILAQTAFIKGVGLIGPGRAGVFINLVPIFSALMAVLYLHEDFKVYHALGLLLVLGGIALSEKGKAERGETEKSKAEKAKQAV